MRHLYLMALGAILVMLPAHARQTVITASTQASEISLGKYFYYFEDTTRQLQLSDIQKIAAKGLFKKSDTDIPYLGMSASAYWLKFDIDAASFAQDDWVLTCGLASYSDISLFYFNGQTWESYRTGTKFPFHTRPVSYRFFAFPLRIYSETGTVSYFIRIQTERAFTLPLSLQRTARFIGHVIYQEWIYGAYLGILLFFSIYNLILFLAFRERTFLFYAIYIFFSALLLLFYYGYIFQFFLPDVVINPSVAFFYSILAQRCGLILLVISFFNINKRGGNTYRILQGLLLLYVLIFLLSFVFPRNMLTSWQSMLSLLTLGLTTVYGFYFYFKKKLKYARFYLAGHTIYFLFAISNNVSFFDIGLLLPKFIFMHIGEVGILIEAVFLALALTDKYTWERQQIVRAKEKAQEQLINIQRKINEELEQKVAERTAELQETNEELRLQKEEIGILNNYLEQQVAARTEELNHTVNRLIRQNENLEQFSYIISHNIKAPVASIKGLLNIYDTSEISSSINASVFEHLQITTHKLDMLVGDLSEILSIRNTTDFHKEWVHLDNLIRNSLEHVADQIMLHNVHVEKQLLTQEVYTSKNFLQSVLNHLIDNAVKFRDPERPLEIVIKAETIDGKHCISVSDNGLGVDISDDYKIFGLYQRMHTHVEGKGLGLYLCKTQVEALGGYIKVESTPGEGSTFYVWLPNDTD
ncbi:sensor histidine kinase [Rhodoflexus caldus]|uniref:sensor histidine kinase n=1 Tax=Rhodoflexus caldus TaxID=2891236 RepID=UPI00202A28B7|nr:sensor histidine kinase [Rhodoflexus caldus]